MKWRSHKRVSYRNTNFFQQVGNYYRKLLPEFVLSIPAAGSSWAASHGDMLIPRQHKAGEAAFLAWKHHFPETHHNAGIRQIQTRPSLWRYSYSHHHFTPMSCAHRVMDRSWSDPYLLAPVWCHGEYRHRTVNGAFWVTTHLLADRNCLFVCLHGPQHAVNNSSYPSQSSFSAHWAGDSATSCFVILDSFQKNISWQNKTK